MERSGASGREGVGRLLAAVASLLLLCAAVLAALPAAAAVLRGGEHSEFSRLVFDWQKRVDYHVARDGQRLTITFTHGGDLDLLDTAGLRKAALTRISDPQAAHGPDG